MSDGGSEAREYAYRAYIAELERKLAKARHDRDRYRAKLNELMSAIRQRGNPRK